MENIIGRDFKFLIGKSIVNVRNYTDGDDGYGNGYYGGGFYVNIINVEE